MHEMLEVRALAVLNDLITRIAVVGGLYVRLGVRILILGFKVRQALSLSIRRGESSGGKYFKLFQHSSRRSMAALCNIETFVAIESWIGMKNCLGRSAG